MTNFSSFEADELSIEDFQLKVVNETDNYIVLRPTEMGYSGNDYVVKVEAPQRAPTPLPKRRDFNSFGSFQRALDEHYRSHNRPRMLLRCAEGDVFRFWRDQSFEHVVPKRITEEYNFKEIAEWVHTQTKGGWSVRVYADKDNRPGKSFLVFYFETKESAALFKLFNI